MNKIGNKHGCHTCRVKKADTKKGNWVLDHQPPNGLAKKDKSKDYSLTVYLVQENKEEQ